METVNVEEVVTTKQAVVFLKTPVNGRYNAVAGMMSPGPDGRVILTNAEHWAVVSNNGKFTVDAVVPAEVVIVFYDNIASVSFCLEFAEE